MKRILVIVMAFACLVLFSNNTFAQVSISLGAKAGVSIPNLKSKGDNPLDNNWKSRSGPYMGLVADVHLSENFALTGELNFASQGGKRIGAQAIPNPNNPPIPTYLYADFSNIAVMNYAEVPVMATYTFSSLSKMHFLLQAGVYGGFLLRAKNVSSGEGMIYLDEQLTIPVSPTQSFDHTTNIKDDIKSFNYGVQGGLGISFDMSKSILRFVVGGNYGLTTIQKDTANGSDHTGALTITVAYLFHI
ncbi:MAG: PorT family protein [Bacteroidetes bacterium]|nr:PorT family protein [Bacteroidota bacterium]